MDEKQKKLKVGFIGNINAMPMMVALEFVKAGHDVKYIVDNPPSSTLHRPEYHYPEISYPYPDWIVENITGKYTRYLTPLAPKIFLLKLVRELRDRDVIFFNDYGFQISKYFPKKTIKVALFSGSDLADHADNCYPFNVLKSKGLKKFFYFFIRFIQVHRQRVGIKSCHILSYFPKGMSKKDDQLIHSLMQNYNYMDVRRYGTLSQRALKLEYSGARDSKVLNILVPLRFLTTPENDDEYKGNDLIIKAISAIYKNKRNIRVHFFEKGPEKEIEFAKKLCSEHEIEPIISWHPELPMQELIELYKSSDVVIDQVGNHWPGAITFIGLHMGKPVIANMCRDVCNNYWDEQCPILVADDVASIIAHIESCLSYDYRETVGKKSYSFARKYIGPDYYFRNCIGAIDHVGTHFSEFQR